MPQIVKPEMARGSLKAEANVLGAFVNEVNAQASNALTAEQASILTKLAREL